MKPISTHTLLVGVVWLGLAGCSDAGPQSEPAASSTTPPLVASPSVELFDTSAAASTTTMVSSNVPNAFEPTEDLWSRYIDAEGEASLTLADLVAAADETVLGRVTAVKLGRVDQVPGNLYSRRQFVDYVIEVERTSAYLSAGTISFESQLVVSSPELDQAFFAGDLVEWEAQWAAALSVAHAAEVARVPDNQTLFFFDIDPEGKYRFFHSASIIINDVGLATDATPPRETHLSETWKLIAGRPFDEIVAIVFHGSE